MQCIIFHPYTSTEYIRTSCVIFQPTVPAAGKQAPRAGNIGHITRIVNKLVHLAHNRSHILTCLQVSYVGCVSSKKKAVLAVFNIFKVSWFDCNFFTIRINPLRHVN